MEWMDRYRLLGGWLWVAAGLVLEVVAIVAWDASPGPVTWLLAVDIVVLAVVLAVRRTSATAWLLGWLTAVLYAADFGGAVADRFGAFGEPGSPGVSWGSWDAFLDYTEALLPVSWHPLVTAAAVGATAIEVALTVLLVTGWQRRWVAKAAAGLCLLYTVTMGVSAVREDVAAYAMPLLVGGALLLSATPSRRAPATGAVASAPVATTVGR